MASDLIERLETQSEYKGVFVSAEDAMIMCDFNTLLIVVDVNRPAYVESESLLQSINKVAVIDHHRRAADYIENAVVSLHEPYASSASELVSELLQYLVPTSSILTAEAEAMLSGIYLDTKGFSTRTGVRTFEAAAYLRRAGAEASDVKRLFQSSFDQYMERQKIISSARNCGQGVIFAITGEQVTASRRRRLLTSCFPSSAPRHPSLPSAAASMIWRSPHARQARSTFSCSWSVWAAAAITLRRARSSGTQHLRRRTD